MRIINKIAKNSLSLVFAVAILAILGLATYFSSVKANVTFQGGDMFRGRNRTTNQADLSDPVNATTGQVVQLNALAWNAGSDNATNTRVNFDLSNAQSPKATIAADGGTSLSDTLTITPSGSSLVLISGSGSKFGPGCDNGCALSDSDITSGVNLGTVLPGGQNSFQVIFKVTVTGNPPTQNALFRTGNVVDGGDRSSGSQTWVDPISANHGDIIEFRVQVINDGNVAANNAIVKGTLPINAGNSLNITGSIAADNTQTVSDTATVQISGDPTTEVITYLPGHARMFGPGCNTADGCPLSDNIATSGVNIGTVNPGVTNSFQVAFKAILSNSVPTVTPTLTPTPVAPTSRCVDLIASTTDGTVPLTVNFTGQGEDTGGNIAQYEFNFGDSSGSQSQIVDTTGNQATHTYFNAGNFIASLLVKDSRGVWQGGDQCQVNLTARSKPVVLAAQAPPALPKTGVDVVLIVPTALGAGYILYKRFKLL